MDQVLINDFESAYQATYHLINQGYKNIAHFTSELKIKIYEDMYQGYRQALRDNGIKFDKDLVVEGNLQLEGGQQSTRFLLDKKSILMPYYQQVIMPLWVNYRS